MRLKLNVKLSVFVSCILSPLCVCHIYLLLAAGENEKEATKFAQFTQLVPHPSEIKCCAK